MDDDLREGDLHTLVGKEDADIAVERALRGEDILLLDVGNELEHDAAVGQLLDAEVARSAEIEILACQIHVAQALVEHLLERAQVGLVGDAALADRQRGVARTVLEVADVGVVDDLEVVAGVLDGRGAHADVADDAAEIVEHDDIADGVLALEDDEQAGDHVLDQALRAEAQDQADDADAGEDRRGVDAEDAQAPDHAGDDGEVFQPAGEHRGDRAGADVPSADKAEDQLADRVEQPDDADGQQQRQPVGQGDLSAALDEEVGLLKLRDLARRFFGEREPVRIEQEDDEQGRDGGADQGSVPDKGFLFAFLVHGCSSCLSVDCR